MFCITDWKSDINQAHNSDKRHEFPISQNHQGTEVMLKSFLLTYWYESMVHRHPSAFPEMWNGLIIVQKVTTFEAVSILSVIKWRHCHLPPNFNNLKLQDKQTNLASG